MNRHFFRHLSVATALSLTVVLVLSGVAVAATPSYVIANDDATFPATGVSFYTIGANGALTLKQQVVTGGTGIGGGYFGSNRILAVNGNQGCVYTSEAGTGDVVGIVVSSLTVGGSAAGSQTDSGASNGIGLTTNGQYLYASYVDSNTIGTFKLRSGCGLSFVGDTTVVGLDSGFVNGVAAKGNILIATYTDGTIESFDISGGTPVSHGDKQFSTATLLARGATYPNSIDITSDGHFAIFGDTSTLMVVEVSDISSGKLTKTVVHKSKATISSSNIMLSPDETMLYVINTQGDSVTALFFDNSTGKLRNGCTSGPIQGVSVNWSYLTGVGLASQTGNGGGVYVAEFGVQSGIALVQLTVSRRKCTLQEAQGSPFLDPNSPGLISIGTFPPRAF